MNTQCQLCITNDQFTKYCMYGMNTNQGKCCLRDSGDECLKEQFTCTDKIPTSFTYHKYAYCSFDPTICGSPNRILFAK